MQLGEYSLLQSSSMHAWLSGQAESVLQPLVHKLFSHISPLLHSESALHSNLQTLPTQCSSDRQS